MVEQGLGHRIPAVGAGAVDHGHGVLQPTEHDLHLGLGLPRFRNLERQWSKKKGGIAGKLSHGFQFHRAEYECGLGQGWRILSPGTWIAESAGTKESPESSTAKAMISSVRIFPPCPLAMSGLNPAKKAEIFGLLVAVAVLEERRFYEPPATAVVYRPAYALGAGEWAAGAGILFGGVEGIGVLSLKLGAGLTIHGGAGLGFSRQGFSFSILYLGLDLDLQPNLKFAAELGMAPVYLAIGVWWRPFPFLDLRLGTLPLGFILSADLFIRF